MKVLKIPNFTKDQILRRLRWLMVCVILMDTINTLLGQPPSYSQDPGTAEEFNKFMSIFVRLGSFSFVATSLLYVAGWFILVSLLPRKLAYTSLFAVVLGHYFGASSWLVYHWGFGVQAAVIYAIAISIGVVLCGIPQHTYQSTESANPKNQLAEQVDAVQPATAPDSKSEGSEKPKPESEGRSQQ